MTTSLEQRIAEIKHIVSQFEVVPSIYKESRFYFDGDMVVYDNKIYLCLEQTTEKPGFSNCWIESGLNPRMIEIAYLAESLKIIEELQREIAELRAEVKIAWLNDKIDERQYLEGRKLKDQLNN